MTDKELLALKSSAELRDAYISLYKDFYSLEGEERSLRVKQINIVNDKLNDLYDEGESVDIVVPHVRYTVPYLEIKTFRYSDGKYAYGVSIMTNTAGMSFRFLEKYLSDTKEKAIQKAVAQTLSWVSSNEKGCSKSDKAILDKVKKACEKAIRKTEYQQLKLI
jgi:hypothetical protein